MTAMVNDGNVERMFKMRMIVMMGALLPGIGCYFCIAYTYIFQFDVIKNFTQSDQCPEVNSILPPVSYAIGIWEPQRYFWLFIMFLHCPPRIFFLIVSTTSMILPFLLSFLLSFPLSFLTFMLLFLRRRVVQR
ncbi:unnamed protein product [Nippostrongylus brasiliensis]|uniref:G protein-coupled receptor n=1 Tax=Nippostrongylus brasiliensis TaxID=27835 RepID=A0A0N4YPQ1_NIPBR|nr:unnamed protein product [Nippostrongylus brasiliensis]